MQHIAWLHTRSSRGDKAESRYKQIQGRDPEDFRLIIPECRAEYLLNIALSIGLATNNGFGVQTMTAADIKAYNDVFKADISIWEAETLLKMSSKYVAAINEYDGVDCAPPASQDLQQDRAEISAKILAAFTRRSQANKRSAPIGGRK